MCNLRMRKNQDDTIISLNLRAAMKYINKNQLILFVLISTVGLVISGCATKTKSVENLLNQPATEIVFSIRVESMKKLDLPLYT